MDQAPRLKIVLIVKWHSEKVGYAPNCLSRELAALGHEVHIFTTKYQTYFSHPNYDEIYGKYLGPNILSKGRFKDDLVHIHRLPSWRFGNIIWINGIWKALKTVDPDIVQSFDINEPHTVKLALYHRFFNYKLFTANHFILISFRLLGGWKKLDFKKKLYIKLLFRLPGSIIRKVSKKCYAVTRDAKSLAHLFFGFKYNEVEVSTLGVDTSLYYPLNELGFATRTSIRERLNFSSNEIVCVFSGKITKEKSPLVLAEAIQILRAKGENYSALFIGSGELKEELEKYPNCKVLDFVPSTELADYYRASDIAVWPRSVTTSILDAAACALPVIVSDQVVAYTLFDNLEINYQTQPNILAAKYSTNDPLDLTDKLLNLKDAEVRKSIGFIVKDRIEQNSSWKAIAHKRLVDYAGL
jgi:glycosyltransferase involved in cell wall biosynthesis